MCSRRAVRRILGLLREGCLRTDALGGEARRQRLARSCGANDIFHCRVLPSLVLSIGYPGAGKLSSKRGAAVGRGGQAAWRS
jgi:hypothetical protein